MLVCCSLIILLLIFWIFTSINFPPNLPKFEGTNSDIEAQEKTFITNYYLGKVMSYISNSLVIIAFVIYLTLARHRVQVGYGFFISWIIVFTLLGFVCHVSPYSHHSNGLIAIGALTSILTTSVLIYLIYSAIKLHIERKVQYYEYYKIHKQKNKNGNT
ncbi:hypothetical protein [Mycoplasma crocodyli]|uniref:Transmembrane protein n=1 Tax=Mycoplasma crocodyli (strain ATCC 51981 / MP145) TaxID=512564 RepID=D5E6D1_MYCCM|nr:hypothetical protein [Mycoplasma crocodyli]ADE19897.1 hypothetical protein MCRO_0725 [Mycoplasma crocodyli MP145]